MAIDQRSAPDDGPLSRKKMKNNESEKKQDGFPHIIDCITKITKIKGNWELGIGYVVIGMWQGCKAGEAFRLRILAKS